MPLGNFEYAASVPYGNTFALIGGQDKSDYGRAVLIYEPDTPGWTVTQDVLSESKRSVAAFTVKEEIFPPC